MSDSQILDTRSHHHGHHHGLMTIGAVAVLVLVVGGVVSPGAVLAAAVCIGVVAAMVRAMSPSPR